MMVRRLFCERNEGLYLCLNSVCLSKYLNYISLAFLLCCCVCRRYERGCVRLSWVTSHRCVFLNEVLIVRPNITYINSTVVFYCTVQYVSGMQIVHHQVDAGYTERKKYFFLCVRRLPDDSLSAQPKHVVMYNKRLLY